MINGNSLLREGKMLFASGRPEASINCFTRALEQGADPIATGLSCGTAHMALRRYDEAESDFSQQIGMNFGRKGFMILSGFCIK